MKWFGEPWPSAEMRAPVCENDADRIDVPVGRVCRDCHLAIRAEDRGVAIPAIERRDTGSLHATVHSFHLRCFLTMVLGNAIANDVLSEMEWVDSADL